MISSILFFFIYQLDNLSFKIINGVIYYLLQYISPNENINDKMQYIYIEVIKI